MASTVTIAIAQTKSSAQSVQLRAIVLTSTKVTPGNPVVINGEASAYARQKTDDRIEISVTTADASQCSLRVPIKVTTNARSYLLRISSLEGPFSGTIAAEGGSSITSRALPLNPDRVFGIVTNAPSHPDEQQQLVEIVLSSNERGQNLQQRIEVQVVPQ
jgi:hypothetical protein